MYRIDAAELTPFIQALFRAHGCSENNALAMARVCIEADLRGHAIQGVDHIYSIIRDLGNGVLDGKAIPGIVSSTGATLLADGGGCPGYVGGLFAVDRLTQAARQMGTAVLALRGAGDLFMLGYYAERLARAGLIGIVMTNTWPARVHPTGGIDPVLGTNPLAIGIPTGDAPVVYDAATSASAIGHVRQAGYYGEAIAAGLAIDAHGRPTTSADKALGGALAPMAGHKGFGLGLCIGLLSGAMIGGELGAQLDIVAQSGDPRHGVRSHLFIAIDPGAFGDADAARRRASAFLAQIKAGRKMPGVDEIRLPGERSARARRDNLSRGVPILAEVWHRLCRFAREANVDIPLIKTEKS